MRSTEARPFGPITRRLTARSAAAPRALRAAPALRSRCFPRSLRCSAPSSWYCVPPTSWLVSCRTEPSRLCEATWEANRSATPTAIPSTASSSCTTTERSRSRAREMSTISLKPHHGSCTCFAATLARRERTPRQGCTRASRPSRSSYARSAKATACGSCVASSSAMSRDGTRLRQLFEDFAAAPRIEVAGRLIGEHEPWFGRERARDHHALALAHRELVRRLIHPLGQDRALRATARSAASRAGDWCARASARRSRVRAPPASVR